MRKLFFSVAFAVMTVSGLYSQNEVLPFFDKSGKVAFQTEELKSLSDTIAVINHRRDDIAWSRIVYRIIDMREKQNSQLYFPTTPTSRHKNLFRVILEAAINDTLKGYEKKDEDIQPAWDKAPICKERFSEFFIDVTWDSIEQKVRKGELVKRDPVTNKPFIHEYEFKNYSSNVLKYVVQEIVFFNKHYSKMYSKIIAIAPYYTRNEVNVTRINTGQNSRSPQNIWNYFQSSVVCWFLYDELRPYIAKELIVPNGNEMHSTTFDDFFTQRLYYSYILGDSNMFDKMLLQTYTDPASIRREQKRIENEIMNIEQDVWEQ